MSTIAINSVTGAGATADYANNTQNRLPTKTLGQQDFLKLLVTQLSSQDPLNPQKDTEFIAQMAQFSSLEQTKGIQASLSAMRSQQDFTSASAMIGREVTLQIDRETVVRGVVSGVAMEAGVPKIIVNNQPFDMSSVLAVSGTQPQSALNSKKSHI
jgi:flagellar basal-body rod modification protein FlgD